MFEIKNESDSGSTKKNNEDILKELNKDRIEKNCEYAVLVSLLELDSDLYNSGIVDFSHRYAKMYIVRPQCFLPILSLLRNASIKALKYKAELEFVKSQVIEHVIRPILDSYEYDYEQIVGKYTNKKYFDITIGGLGLTGTIVHIQLKLENFVGEFGAIISRQLEEQN